MQRDRSFEQQRGSASAGGLLQIPTDAAAALRTACHVNGADGDGRFTEIDRMLRDAYAQGGPAKTKTISAILRTHPELTRPMLWKRAQYLQLAQHRTPQRRWNPAETRLLQDFINELPIKVIAERLRRPIKSVLGKVRSLEMSARLTSGLSISQAASDLQVSHHTVQTLIRTGALVLGEDRRITEESYRKYCQGLHAAVRADAVPADALAALVDRSNGVSSADVRTTAAIYLIVFGGLSVPEIVRLLLSDVQWIDSGCARIQVRGGRCPKERTVTITGAAGRALRDHRCSRPDTSATDQLFVNEDGTPVTAQSLESELHARGRRLGVPVPVSGRALRHSYAFRFLERECRPGSNDAFFVLPKLSRLMGHYSAETVQMYVGVLHPKKGGRQKKSAIVADDDSY